MSNDDSNQKVAKHNDTNGKNERSKRRAKRKRYRSPQRRLIVGLMQFLILAYLGLLGVLIVMESRLVYPGAYMDDSGRSGALTASLLPTGVSDAAPSAVVSVGATSQSAARGPRIETVEYESTDGVMIRSRLLELGPEKPTVLYFHGNGIKAAWMDGWITKLSSSLDANVMAAEYRGYNDDVTPTEKGVLADCFAARDYLCDRYQVAADDVILFGESLGGGCAVAVASQGGAKALILGRTFDRMIDVAAEVYPFVPVRWLMRNRFDSMAKLTVYRGPLIVIHGTADTLIPIAHARRLYDSARTQPKHFIEVDGLGHMEPLPDQTLGEIAATLEQCLKDGP
jgi:pimeloyl-ACP methyl ester carboxylesterase